MRSTKTKLIAGALLALSGLFARADVLGPTQLLNIFGTTNIPVAYVRFYPPPAPGWPNGAPISSGTNLYLPQGARAFITNGIFGPVTLIGPSLYYADFGIVTIPILSPGNTTNTWTFATMAQLAINAQMFAGTNVTVTVMTNITTVNSTNVYSVTNGFSASVGNAGILVVTNNGTNFAISTSFLLSDVTNAIMPNARLAVSTNMPLTNATASGTFNGNGSVTMSGISSISANGFTGGSFVGAHIGDGSQLTGIPFATNSSSATNAQNAGTATNVYSVLGWTNMPANALSNLQAGVSLATTPSAQLTLTNSGASRSVMLIATNIGTNFQGVLVSAGTGQNGTGGYGAVAAGEFDGHLVGVADQATHATNADSATTAIAGWPTTLWATNTFVGISNALGFQPATNGATITSVAWTDITGTPSLATNTYVGISNALNFPAATNGGVLNISQVSNPNWATNSNAGITNPLGYIPATNSYAGITNSLGFNPIGTNVSINLNNHNITNVTSLYVGQITVQESIVGNLSGDASSADQVSPQNIGIVNPSGPMVSSNFTGGIYSQGLVYTYNAGLLTNLNGFSISNSSMPQSAFAWVVATNGFAGLTEGLGFTPATNTFSGITNSLGYFPATNSFLAITNLLGYLPATNGAVTATNAINNSSRGSGTNTVFQAGLTGESITLTNPTVPVGVELRAVGSEGLNVRGPGNSDNVLLEASQITANGTPGFTGNGAGLTAVAASSLASGASVISPQVQGGTFLGGTFTSPTINGATISSSNQLSIVGAGLAMTNSANAAYFTVSSNMQWVNVDQFGTTNQYGTNGFFLLKQTNGNFILVTNGNLSVSGTITGSSMISTNFTGNGYFITNVPVPLSNSLFVAMNGNDAQGLRGTQIPFATLQAAKTAAQGGDTVFVLPGNYTNNSLLKPFLNWFFYPGATVWWMCTTNPGGQQGIFDDTSLTNGTTNVIGGLGRFYYQEWNNPNGYATTNQQMWIGYMNNLSNSLGCIVITNPATDVRIQGDEVRVEAWDWIATPDTNGTAINWANGGDGAWCIWNHNCTNSVYTFNKIGNLANAYPWAFQAYYNNDYEYIPPWTLETGVNGTLVSPNTPPQQDNGIYWDHGNCHVNIQEIEGMGSSVGIWVANNNGLLNFPNGTGGTTILGAETGSTNGIVENFWATCDTIASYFYDDARNVNARDWVDAKLIKPSKGGTAAINDLGDDKLYIRAEKIAIDAGSATHVLELDGNNQVGSTWVPAGNIWITAQKVTAPSADGALIGWAGIGNMNCWINVDQWEDEGGHSQFCGFSLGGAGATNVEYHIRGQTAISHVKSIVPQPSGTGFCFYDGRASTNIVEFSDMNVVFDNTTNAMFTITTNPATGSNIFLRNMAFTMTNQPNNNVAIFNVTNLNMRFNTLGVYWNSTNFGDGGGWGSVAGQLANSWTNVSHMP